MAKKKGDAQTQKYTRALNTNRLIGSEAGPKWGVGFRCAPVLGAELLFGPRTGFSSPWDTNALSFVCISVLLKFCRSCHATQQRSLYNLCPRLKSFNVSLRSNTHAAKCTNLKSGRYSVGFYLCVHRRAHHSKLDIQHCQHQRSPSAAPLCLLVPQSILPQKVVAILTSSTTDSFCLF